MHELPSPRYSGALDEYADRADSLGDDFLERLEKVGEVFEKGGNCDAVTIAFTHPQFVDKFRLEQTIHLENVYNAAVEVASFSGESVTRDYFGKIYISPRGILQEHELEQSLSGAESVWYVSADVRDPKTQKDAGYNHMIGIVPAPEPDRYIVMDISGYINPLVPLSMSELYQEIQGLPVGDQYVQGIISFRDEAGDTERVAVDDYYYFVP